MTPDEFRHFHHTYLPKVINRRHSEGNPIKRDETKKTSKNHRTPTRDQPQFDNDPERPPKSPLPCPRHELRGHRLTATPCNPTPPGLESALACLSHQLPPLTEGVLDELNPPPPPPGVPVPPVNHGADEEGLYADDGLRSGESSLEMSRDRSRTDEPRAPMSDKLDPNFAHMRCRVDEMADRLRPSDYEAVGRQVHRGRRGEGGRGEGTGRHALAYCSVQYRS